ncbi:MAG TPA: DUF2752 domain-containing protein [Planctomycetota bacterium]|nr:DUF2752 domain-containing protein [Planctomycetota bacterium]
MLAASFLYFPVAFNGPVLCPLALIVGMPCPGCGITRAFGLATHGRFLDAFEYHALWPFLLAYFAFLWVYQIVESVKGEPPKLPTYRIAATAMFFLLGFWAIRLVWFFSHGGLSTMAHDNAISRLLRLFS